MHKEHLDELWLLVTQGGGERAQERFTMGGAGERSIFTLAVYREVCLPIEDYGISHIRGGQAIFTRMLNSWRPLTFLFLSEVPLQDLFTNRKVECPNLAFVTLRLCTIPSGGRWGSTTPPPPTWQYHQVLSSRLSMCGLISFVGSRTYIKSKELLYSQLTPTAPTRSNGVKDKIHSARLMLVRESRV